MCDVLVRFVAKCCCCPLLLLPGYSLSRRVLIALVRRYGGKERKLAFDDFVMVVTKVVVHMGETCNAYLKCTKMSLTCVYMYT